jgi:hypothetical protein
MPLERDKDDMGFQVGSKEEEVPGTGSASCWKCTGAGPEEQQTATPLSSICTSLGLVFDRNLPSTLCQESPGRRIDLRAR